MAELSRRLRFQEDGHGASIETLAVFDSSLANRVASWREIPTAKLGPAAPEVKPVGSKHEEYASVEK